MEPVGTAIQAERLKRVGNEYYQKKRFAAAIDAYTEAITLCPKVPVYWTNRALCHRKLNDWSRVEEDCRKAIGLDHQSIKGHYMLGLALLEKEKYAQGVKELERALDFGRSTDPRGYMVEEIWQELSKAKYLEWERASSTRSWELQYLKETCEMALRETFSHDSTQTDGFLEQMDKPLNDCLKALDLVFEKACQADKPTEVPDYLCCCITLDIFRDPVITPSGVTYERSVILEHLQKVGKFDPVTHEPLNASQLISNLSIKAAVHSYLEEHGWAYKMD